MVLVTMGKGGREEREGKEGEKRGREGRRKYGQEGDGTEGHYSGAEPEIILDATFSSLLL